MIFLDPLVTRNLKKRLADARPRSFLVYLNGEGLRLDWLILRPTIRALLLYLRSINDSSESSSSEEGRGRITLGAPRKFRLLPLAFATTKSFTRWYKKIKLTQFDSFQIYFYYSDWDFSYPRVQNCICGW